MNFGLEPLAATSKLRVMEKVVQHVARKRRNGPFKGIDIVADEILAHIKYKRPIYHSDIRNEDARALEKLVFTVEEVEAFRRRRAERRELIQKIMAYLLEKTHLNVQETKRETLEILGARTSEYLSVEEIKQIRDAEILFDLDVKFAFTGNRLDAMQALWTYTTMSAEQCFAYIDTLNGKVVTKIPAKISYHLINTRLILSDISEKNLNLNFDELVAEVKRKITQGEVKLEMEFFDLVLTERFKAQMIEQTFNIRMNHLFLPMADNFIKTTLSQTYTTAVAIKNSLTTWINCVTEHYCPRIIPQPFSSLNPDKDVRFNININADNKAHSTLLSIAHLIAEEHHIDVAAIVYDMIHVSQGGKSAHPEIGGYESVLKSLNLSAEQINELFTDQMKQEFAEVSATRSLHIEIQDVLSMLSVAIFTKPMSGREALITEFADWMNCYLQNNCIAGALNGTALWSHTTAAVSNLTQIAASPVAQDSLNFTHGFHLTKTHHGHAAADNNLSTEYVITACLAVLAIAPLAKMGYDLYFKSHFFKPAKPAKKERLLSVEPESDCEIEIVLRK